MYKYSTISTMISTKIVIKAPASTVWKALTDKSQMKEWYFDIPDFNLEEGATFYFYEPGGANEYHHRCQIREVIPHTKLSYTWRHPSHSKEESVVSWFLKEVDEGTEVILQHEGIENFADAGPAFARESYQVGWEELLLMLKNHITES